MHGSLVAASRVKLSDGFSAVRAVNFISVTFINVCTLLWVFVVILGASSSGEMFCSCFAIQLFCILYSGLSCRVLREHQTAETDESVSLCSVRKLDVMELLCTNCQVF